MIVVFCRHTTFIYNLWTCFEFRLILTQAWKPTFIYWPQSSVKTDTVCCVCGNTGRHTHSDHSSWSLKVTDSIQQNVTSCSDNVLYIHYASVFLKMFRATSYRRESITVVPNTGILLIGQQGLSELVAKRLKKRIGCQYKFTHCYKLVLLFLLLVKKIICQLALVSILSDLVYSWVKMGHG